MQSRKGLVVEWVRIAIVVWSPGLILGIQAQEPDRQQTREEKNDRERPGVTRRTDGRAPSDTRSRDPRRADGSRRGGGPAWYESMRRANDLVARFDKNDDGWLQNNERKEARAALKESQRGRRFWFPRPGNSSPEAAASAPLSPSDVKLWPDAPLYAPDVLRTFFLTFENDDWEAELSEFKGTDVDVPAAVTVDGTVFKDVGVHFRGSSSYMGVPPGRKRSLNLSFDLAHRGQRLRGYKTLELLNSHGDATFARSYLYYHIARNFLPAPRANFVRVAINGEDWGVYVNQQQYNKDFLAEWFGTKRGTRWKVNGDPRRRSFSVMGEDPRSYRAQFEIKGKDDDAAWARLAELCHVLNETPPECLEEALAPLLNVDRALWFLALDNVLVNADSYYFSRTSDYSLYLDPQGRFHLIPRDGNETFRAYGRGLGGSRGFDGRDAGSSGTELDPLIGADDEEMTLIHRLLAPPAMRARYLAHVRSIATEWLDLERLSPVLRSVKALIGEELRRDARKLESFAAFEAGFGVPATDSGAKTDDSRSSESNLDQERARGGRFRRSRIDLVSFARKRREFLLAHPEIAKPRPRIETLSIQSPTTPPRAGERVVVEMSAGQGVEIGSASLYWAVGQLGAFVPIEMERHGNRFVAEIPPQDAGTDIAYYVAARSEEHGTTVFHPSNTELGARRYRVAP